MLSPSWKVFVFVLVSILACHGVRAELMGEPHPAVIPNLHVLARNSGYIFGGTVLSVERIAPSRRDAVAVMRVTFRVDSAIRGVSRGQRLVIHEWGGLWQSGERYRPGERVLLFLYPPSRLGLTSPVEGPTGRFRINPGGRIVVPRGQTRPVSPRTPETGLSGRPSLVGLRELVGALQRELEERQ